MFTNADWVPTAKGDQFIVAEKDLLQFQSAVRSHGLSIVVSSPVGAGYAVTVR
jgi:hypothetical protein